MVLLFCYSHVHEVNPLLIILHTCSLLDTILYVYTQLHFLTQQKCTCKQLQFLLNTSFHMHMFRPNKFAIHSFSSVHAATGS